MDIIKALLMEYAPIEVLVEYLKKGSLPKERKSKMAEYGNGIALKQKFEYDRERIEHAFKHELMCGETEDGFEYAPCTKEEADEYILLAFDSAVHLCLESNRVGNCLEQIIHENNLIDDSAFYRQFIAKMCDSYKGFDGSKSDGE